MKTGPLLMRHLMSKKVGAGMANLSRFSEAVGDDMPSLPLNKIGRFRLQQFLRKKFGAGWKNGGIANSIMRAFDVQMKRGG